MTSPAHPNCPSPFVPLGIWWAKWEGNVLCNQPVAAFRGNGELGVGVGGEGCGCGRPDVGRRSGKDGWPERRPATTTGKASHRFRALVDGNCQTLSVKEFGNPGALTRLPSLILNPAEHVPLGYSKRNPTKPNLKACQLEGPARFSV